MTEVAALTSIVAALDTDRITDLIGIPLAVLVVGLLALIDLVDLSGRRGIRHDTDIDTEGTGAGDLPIPALLTNRRTLVIAASIAGLAFAIVIASRIVWIAT